MTRILLSHKIVFLLLSLLIIGVALPSPSAAENGVPAKEEIVQKGARISFSVSPFHSNVLREGEMAEVSFRITDETTGNPIQALSPGAWVDARGELRPGKKEGQISCREKVKLYVQGLVGYRPLIDLTSYFILALNNDHTISVIDPIKGITGRTQLFTMIYLKSPGEDWVTSADEKKLFVTMPKVNMVAVADLESFKVVKNIPVGTNPASAALQPDGKYLWVGNNGSKKERGSVTVIDSGELRAVAEIQTASGRREITFSSDSLYAFVANRERGTVTIVDTQRLEKVKEIETGKLPSSIDYSTLTKAVFVAHEGDGAIAVIDGAKHEIRAKIATKPGLKAIRFDPSGRWGFAVNATESLVYIIDVSTNAVAYTVEVAKEPDQVVFTDAFAYVRSRRTTEIRMISLKELGKEKAPPTFTITGGQRPPADSPHTSVADSIVRSQEYNAVLITNPADRQIYYYAEGMAASMGSFRGYGGAVQRAAMVINRVLRMTEPGVYSAKIRIPASGDFDVAFLLDSPQIVHCFSFSAQPNPVLARKDRGMRIEFLTTEGKVIVGKEFRLQFKVTDPSSDEPLKGIRDFIVQTTVTPGGQFDRYRAKHIADGVYEVNFTVRSPGAYYITLAVPSMKVDARKLPHLILRATEEKTSK